MLNEIILVSMSLIMTTIISTSKTESDLQNPQATPSTVFIKRPVSGLRETNSI